MGRRLAIVGVLALAVGACVATPNPAITGLATPRASRSPSAEAKSAAATPDLATTVPWSPATAAPSPAPSATSWPNGPACRSDQLGTAGSLDFGGVGLGFYTIWNEAADPCSVGRAVSVSILDAGGHDLSVPTTLVTQPPMCGGTGGQCPPPGPTEPPWVFMPPSASNAQDGGESGNLTWTNWCGPQPAQPLTLLITHADGTLVRTPGMSAKVPACTNASKPSALVVAPVTIGGAWPTDPPSIPPDNLSARLELTGSAIPGQPFHYVVVLTNATASAVTLTPCPTYQERLNTRTDAVVEEHVLNCAGVGAIAPGQNVRFEMVIDIPASLPASSDSALVWFLDPNYSQGFAPPIGGPEAKVTVAVAAP
jgi:hypothetical protein